MTQTADVETRLRAALLDLDFAPGERLPERSLETFLNASRTPVRAALLRLEREGLVSRDGRAWISAPLDAEELSRVYEYRVVLEVGAARLSIERSARGALSEAAFEPLTAILNLCDLPLGQSEWERAGAQFHVAMAQLSGNAFLARGVEDAMTRLARARWLSASGEAARAEARSDHRAIFAAVRDGDAARAERLIVQHNDAGRSRLIAAMAAAPRSLRARGFTLRG
jgi:DNA-binding GntR family transcriptional regulator